MTIYVGGDYQVSIRAQDNLGKWSEYVTKTLSVRTNLAPIIAYVPIYGQPDQPAPTSVAFAPYEGTTDDEGVNRYTYDFADGSPLLETTDGYVEHVFSNAGTFNVVITAYDFYGLSDSFTVPLTIKANQPPVIADIIIGGTDQIKPEKLTFDVRSVATDSDGFIVNYEFSLNGFSTTQGQGGGYWEVPFFGGGEFQVQVTVTDNYGASASRSKSFFVDDNYAPVAVIDFDKDVIAVGESIELRASNSSDEDGTIVKYSWTLPDIGIVESQTTSFSLVTAGSYVIKLEVEDDKGKKATTQRSIRVNSPPEIIAECFLDELTGNTILCSAEGSSDEDGIASYTWSLDSNAFTGSQVSIPLTRYGNLIIGIELTDNFGAVASLYLPVYVENPNALPLASFDYQMEMGLVANFDAESSLAEGRKISKLLWEFEDGTSIESSELTLSKSFQSVGEQNIKLTVFDDLNRTNTIEKTIYIYSVSVPDPGEAGRLTAEGVDSDYDGLRDDVQREIASIASGDIQREVTLKKAASSYQNIATGPIDRAQSVVFMRASLDHFDCYLYQTDFSDQAIKDFGRLKAKVYNTKERFFNSLKSMDDFSGEVVNVSLDRQEYAQKCSN